MSKNYINIQLFDSDALNLTVPFCAAFLAKGNALNAEEPAYLASELVQFYENDMNGLFTTSLYHKITTGWGYWGLKYPLN